MVFLYFYVLFMVFFKVHVLIWEKSISNFRHCMYAYVCIESLYARVICTVCIIYTVSLGGIEGDSVHHPGR